MAEIVLPNGTMLGGPTGRGGPAARAQAAAATAATPSASGA